jgi:hypothetical protein
VTNINARGGVLYLEVNSGQQENYRFWKASESAAGEFNLDLQDVRLANYRFKFGNHLKGLHIDSDLKRLEMKGDFNQSSYRLKGSVHGISREFRHQDLVYSGERDVSAWVALDVNNDLIGIEEGTIEFSGIRLTASGQYDKGENGSIDMNLSGQGLDISSFTSLFSGKTRQTLTSISSMGNLILRQAGPGKSAKPGHRR